MSLDLTLKNSQFNFKVANLHENRIYEFEDFRLDAAHLLLYRRGGEVSLTPKAVETLLALIERRGEVVAKNELMETIWTDAVVEESNLSQYLHVLRKTLGNRLDGKPFIETLKRRGYRFNGEVRVWENQSNGDLRNISPQRRAEDAEEIKNSRAEDKNGRQTENFNPRAHRVERRGNVLALADWQDKKYLSENEIAAQNDRLSSIPDSKSNFRFTIIAATAVFLLATFAFVWFKFASGEKSSTTKSELTIVNLTNGEAVQSPTVSPDGKYFVYHTSDGGEMARLWLQQVGQSSRVEIIPSFAGRIHGKTFTPDSRFVYFVAEENPNAPSALYRVSTLGGVLTKILTDTASPVSFSPDGREMVFRRLNKETNQSSLIVASNDGSSERVLLTRTDAEMILHSAWSPDGLLIAFGEVSMQKTAQEGACALMGIEPLSGETKSLSPERWDTCYRMAWTRNGQGLVFVGTKFQEVMTTRRDQIFYVSTPDGESRRLTTSGIRHDPETLSVTDDDAILALPFNRSSQIWAMDAASGDARTAVPITNGQADGRGGIAPLPDGRVGYVTRAGDNLSVWLMNADGTDRKQITTDPPTAEELRASPDGRYFVFAAKTENRQTHFFRVDASGANLKQLTFGDSNEVDSTVSSDGKWIVYYSTIFNSDYGKTTLWKISIDGGAPHRLPDIKCLTPHFSPDGALISCISGEKQIRIISAADGSVVKTFEAVEIPALNAGARWMPDGKALTYIVVRQNCGNIWQQPVDGSAARPLTDFTSGDIYNFAFSTDGSRLYLARGYQIRDAVLIRNFK